MRTPPGYTRAIAFGETGSGKSRLGQLIADRYGRTVAPVWCIDSRRNMPRPLNGYLIRPQDGDLDWQNRAPAHDFVNAWCAQAFEHAKQSKQSLMVHLDETDMCVMPGSNNGIPPALVRIVMQGRGHGVSYFFAVRRPVEIPPTLRSQAEDLYFFRMTDGTDLRVAREKRLPLFGDRGITLLRRGAFWHCVAGQNPHYHEGAFTECPHLE